MATHLNLTFLYHRRFFSNVAATFTIYMELPFYDGFRFYNVFLIFVHFSYIELFKSYEVQNSENSDLKRFQR